MLYTNKCVKCTKRMLVSLERVGTETNCSRKSCIEKV